MTQNEGKLTVDRSIDAPAQDIFAVLTNPENHASLDGSGMVQSEEKTDRVTGVGQVFRMNMFWDKLGGEYQTDNHVVGFDPNKLLAWKTADAGKDPAGWEWVWELEATSPDSTNVTLTYDWSKVTDKDVLRQVPFPVVEAHQLEGSLAKLAEIVSGAHQ
ncbi:SRPBCC domain-containing protein [Paenarthrobacter sp. Z7-10]|uniref:SRPBCC family protein n=1 Tax=Paenarthrobacter sp. Z7-10 TaxID=2787635 RepID=UPI0022A9F051|nr:SRPBCC family protein [Paenarthrobacter sp. Z7-10]MCZ2403177.1 SRPBCC domain-containing protein [Paenarthrobacter sp. Z7-10]